MIEATVPGLGQDVATAVHQDSDPYLLDERLAALLGVPSSVPRSDLAHNIATALGIDVDDRVLGTDTVRILVAVAGAAQDELLDFGAPLDRAEAAHYVTVTVSDSAGDRGWKLC